MCLKEIGLRKSEVSHLVAILYYEKKNMSEHFYGDKDEGISDSQISHYKLFKEVVSESKLSL